MLNVQMDMDYATRYIFLMGRNILHNVLNVQMDMDYVRHSLGINYVVVRFGETL